MVNFWLNIRDINRWKKWIQHTFVFWNILFLYVPLLTFILLSFQSESDKQLIPSYLTWNFSFSNYLSFFSASSTDNMWISLGNSLLISLISIPIALFIGLLTAISIWKNYGKGKFSTFIFCNITISSPDIVQGIAFFIMFSSLFVPLGVSMGFLSVIVTHIALLIPYVVIFIYPKLNKLNPQLFSAAYDLNFNLWESLRYVIIPILTPDILGIILLLFSISFDDYIITNFLRGNISTISSELYNMKTGIKSWASVLGSLVIIFVTSCVLIYTCVRIIKDKKG